jgi:hypothetical protein
MTSQSSEAFVKRAERLQGITACVICSDLRLEEEKKLRTTGGEMPNVIHLIALCETLLNCFVSDQNVEFNTPNFCR